MRAMIPGKADKQSHMRGDISACIEMQTAMTAPKSNKMIRLTIQRAKDLIVPILEHSFFLFFSIHEGLEPNLIIGQGELKSSVCSFKKERTILIKEYAGTTINKRPYGNIRYCVVIITVKKHNLNRKFFTKHQP